MQICVIYFSYCIAIFLGKSLFEPFSCHIVTRFCIQLLGTNENVVPLGIMNFTDVRVLISFSMNYLDFLSVIIGGISFWGRGGGKPQ